MGFKEKLKKFFTNKLNIAILSISALIVVLALIPYHAIWYIKMIMVILAIDSALLGWKMYIRHKANQDVYDVIECSTKEEKRTVFTKVTSTFDSVNQKSYLIYSICFFVLAVLVLVYVFIK